MEEGLILTRENGYKSKKPPEKAEEPFCEVSYHAGNLNMLKSIVEAVEASEEITREGLLSDLKMIEGLL